FFLREEAQAWLPAGSACAPVPDAVLALSAAAEELWKRRQSLAATGHELSSASPKPVLSVWRSEEHTSELQSRSDLVCRLLLEKKKADISAWLRQQQSPCTATAPYSS